MSHSNVYGILSFKTGAMNDNNRAALIDSLCNQLQNNGRVAFYLAAARASATHRAYASDIAAFIALGGSIPATPQVVAAYLATSDELAVATLRRRLVAIADAHQAGGHVDPTKDRLVRKVFRGICRTRGVAQKAPVPLNVGMLTALVDVIPDDLEGLRDRALLLVGFFCALRRSELVALEVEELSQSTGNWTFNIRRSKTDQNAAGQRLALPSFGTPLCPTAALKSWLRGAGITTGRIFRKIDRAGRLGWESLPAGSVGGILRRRATVVGVDCKQLSAHSLRSGFAVSAVRAGVSLPLIQAVTRHATLAGLEPYVRAVDPLSAAQMVGFSEKATHGP